MLWPTLQAVQRSTRLEFAPWLAARHHFVRCLSGQWTRTLGAPAGARHVRGRVWELAHA